VLVVYETKYGNTKKAAETIAEGMEEAGEIKASIEHVDKVDLNKINDFEAIIIGSPTYAGRQAGSIKKFINKLADLSLGGKKFAVFDTHLGKSGGFLRKAVKKMESQVGKKISNFKKIKSGLPVQVKGMKGPLVEGELDKCRDYGKDLAAKLLG